MGKVLIICFWLNIPDISISFCGRSVLHIPAKLEDCEKGSFLSEGWIPIAKLMRAEHLKQNGF